VAEIDAHAAVAAPADEGVHAAALVELDQHRLAEPSLERTFDHRAPRRDVEHGDAVRLSTQMEERGLDDAFAPFLAAAVCPRILRAADGRRCRSHCLPPPREGDDAAKRLLNS
jgi:hypothetical protein